MNIRDSFLAERASSFWFQGDAYKPILLSVVLLALLIFGMVSVADAAKPTAPVEEEWSTWDEVVYVLSAGTISPSGSRSGTRRL